jgi:hypothetical protein
MQIHKLGNFRYWYDSEHRLWWGCYVDESERRTSDHSNARNRESLLTYASPTEVCRIDVSVKPVLYIYGIMC